MDGGVSCVSDGELGFGFGWESGSDDCWMTCAAGRAGCARGGHFVAGVPCSGWTMCLVLPLVEIRVGLLCWVPLFYRVPKMRSAMAAASAAGRTSWVRMMLAPARMADTLAAVVAWRRASMEGVAPLSRTASEGWWGRGWAGKPLREGATRRGMWS